MEAYRSGHNGPDSKSGIPQGIVGSNPTASAKKTVCKIELTDFFYSEEQLKKIKNYDIIL